mmetsp:Transcript_18421/g.22553  ORF Transcript_18421/g.22553 Transcript_18421/m.22553 type:complete len:111 (-) Transcript_18421:665-997(-)
MLHISIVTGARSSIVVTLSRKALATAVRRHSNTKRRLKDPFDDTNNRTAIHSNIPVCDSSPTMSIMPNSSPSVLHSWCNMIVLILSVSPPCIRKKKNKATIEPKMATSVR